MAGIMKEKWQEWIEKWSKSALKHRKEIQVKIFTKLMTNFRMNLCGIGFEKLLDMGQMLQRRANVLHFDRIDFFGKHFAYRTPITQVPCTQGTFIIGTR
jgi:hypothetical protein